MKYNNKYYKDININYDILSNLLEDISIFDKFWLHKIKINNNIKTEDDNSSSEVGV